MFDPYKLLKFSIRLFSRLAVIVYSFNPTCLQQSTHAQSLGVYTSEELRNGMVTFISVENIALIFCALHLKSVSIFSILDYPQHERNFARRYKRPMPCQSDFSLTIIVTPKPWSTHDKPIRSLSPQHLTRQIQPWAYTETKRVRPVSRRGRHGFP